MKRIITVTEVEGQGLDALLGQKVTLFCMNYIYAGKLVGVNETDVVLEDASVVYETGEFTAGKFTDEQRIAGEWRVRTAAIESYGVIGS